jgi:hypothetical protein
MTARLPTVRWREPQDVSVRFEVPPAGVFLGMDAGSAPVLLPAIRPGLTRVGVVGDWRIAALLAYRLLGVGCLLTTLTDDLGRWRHLLEAAGTRGTVGRTGVAWPASRADGARHLLVSDLPTPPDPPATEVPCTVVHVTETVPPAGPFWSAVDAVLVAGRGHGLSLARLLGRDDARTLDGIGPAQLGLLDRHRAAAVTAVLADAERALLIGR